jgi:hypothetical protein
LLSLLRLNVFAADTCRLYFRLNFCLGLIHQRILYRETQLFRNNLKHVPAVSILLQTFSLERGLCQINDNFSIAFSLHHKSHVVNNLSNFRLQNWWSGTFLFTIAGLLIGFSGLLILTRLIVVLGLLLLLLLVVLSPLFQLLI